MRARRLFSFPRLFLLLTLVPAVELYLLLQLGRLLGPLPALLVVLGTGALGAALVRREGLRLLGRLADELARGLPPAERLVEGALLLASGLLLLTPGILTDLLGLALLLPPLRRRLSPLLLRWFAGLLLPPGGPGGPPPRPGPPPGEEPPFRHPVA